VRIYLLRHGESIDDVEDSYGGIADFPLTDAGRGTARELAAHLSKSGIQVIYTSPYKRAYETATIVSKALGCELKIIDSLRERNSYGVLSGVNKAKAKEIFAHILGQLKSKPGDYYSDELVPGAEALDSFATRVKKGFDEVVKDAAGRNIISIVTHGNVTRAVYQHILGVGGKVNPGLLAITVLNYEPARIELDRARTHGVEIVQ
jgi:broad specificity phosphatase PhoE